MKTIVQPSSSYKRSLAATRAAFALLFFALGIVACFAYGAWNMPLKSDNQHYFYISERAASGVPPHVSQFDPKHGLSMLLSGAAIRVGRLVGVDDVRAARALSVLVTAASIALAWLLAYRLSNSLLAAHLSAMAMLSFSGFIQLGAMGARPKVFLVFFMFLTMIAVARRRPFEAGLLSALCFLCWQPALLMLGGAAGAFLLHQPTRKTLGRLLAGAVLPNLIYELYFLYQGALYEQLKQAYWFPAKFMTGRFTSFANSIFWLRFHWARGFGDENLLPLVSLLAIAVAWLIAIVRPRWTWNFLKQHPAWTQFCLCTHAAVAFTIYDQQGYPDILLTLPFMAISAAILVAVPGKNTRHRMLRGARMLVGAACLAALAVLAEHGVHRFRYELTLDQQYQLGKKVRLLIDEGKSVYAVGCTHLLAFAHANNHVYFGYIFRGVPEYLQYLGIEPSQYRPLKDGKMPDVILWARGPLLGATSWLGTEYTRPYHADFHAQNVTLWARRETKQAQ